MLSTVGLETMNTINPELNWNIVTKGKRSRKSIARSLNGVRKTSSTSLEQIGDYSGSDSDKVGETFPKESRPGKEEHVPIKKRRHFLRSPSLEPCLLPLCGQDSFEDEDIVANPSSSSGQAANGCYYPGDFSGIELLAAAASMDVDAVHANKEDRVEEDSSMLRRSNTIGFAGLPVQDSKFNQSENFHSSPKARDEIDCALSLNNSNNSTDASQDPCGSSKAQTSPGNCHLKVDRKHWDLNTIMDAWDVSYDDAIVEDKDAASQVRMVDNKLGARVESTHGKTETKLKQVSLDRTYVELEPTYLNDNLHTKANHANNSSGREKSEPSIEEDVDKSNIYSAVSSGLDFQTLLQVVKTDASLCGFSNKMDCSSVILNCDEKARTISVNAVPITGDKGYPCSVVEGEEITYDRIGTWDQDSTGHDDRTDSDRIITKRNDKPKAEVYQSAINVQYNDAEYPQVTSELPGLLNLDGQSVTVADYKVGGGEAYSKGQLWLSELITKCENSKLPNEESQICSVGADEPATSIGKVGSTIDNLRGLDVSPGDHCDKGDGDNLDGFQDGYDSPYEDGELRGLCLYHWDENELENECADYESDGRNGVGSDGADYPCSENVECGSEGSHITERSLLVRKFPEGYMSKNGPSQNPNSLRKHFTRDDPCNVIVGKKDSNGGSGTTVEQSIETATEKDDGGVRRRYFIDRREIVDDRVAHGGEYSSWMSRGKLQPRVGERLSLEPADGKDGFFIKQCRTHRFGGSYSRPERDLGAEKYMGRFRAANHISDRDDVEQWTHWGSRGRYTSGYQGTDGRNHDRPRSINADSGLDFQDHTNNFSRNLRRPFIRRSPMDRDDCFSVRRRGQLNRGISGYRNRERYVRGACREFGDDFDSVPDDMAASVRLSRYFSRKERSFSPASGRGGAHLPLNLQRSRSRSRTRSPKPWHREHNFSNRRQSRSPDFRSDARTRGPFPKPNFASKYGEERDYMSPPMGRFSAQRKWGYSRNFADNNNMRRRMSPDFRSRPNRFDGVRSSGRLKPDEYLRHTMRPAGFTFMNDDGPDDNNYRECKAEAND